MTYREQFHEEHPDSNADMIHVASCPPGMESVIFCDFPSCKACWDREMEKVTEDGKETLPR